MMDATWGNMASLLQGPLVSLFQSSVRPLDVKGLGADVPLLFKTMGAATSRLWAFLCFCVWFFIGFGLSISYLQAAVT